MLDLDYLIKTKKVLEIDINDIPENVVYILTKNNKVVYVGKSTNNNFLGRYFSHLKDKEKDFEKGFIIPVYDEDIAYDIEQGLIVIWSPIHNKKYPKNPDKYIKLACDILELDLNSVFVNKKLTSFFHKSIIFSRNIFKRKDLKNVEWLILAFVFQDFRQKNEDVLENECFRDLTISSDLSNKALASKINVTKRTIQRSIGILEKQGYIEKTTFCNSKVITLNPNIDYHSLLNPSSNFFPMYDGFKINVCATLNEVKLNGNITDEKNIKKVEYWLKECPGIYKNT